MTVIALFSALFSLIFVMTGGGPGYATTTMEFLIYEPASIKVTLARPLYGLILFVITGIVGIVQLRLIGSTMTTLMPPKRQRKIGRWILFGSMMVVGHHVVPILDHDYYQLEI